MTCTRPLLDRLRNSRRLRAGLFVLALASVLAGLHVASHIGGAFPAVAAPAPVQGGGSDGGGHQDDCSLARLAWTGTPMLAPAAWLALLLAGQAGLALAAPTHERRALDAALRWCQQRKHGPPAFSR